MPFSQFVLQSKVSHTHSHRKILNVLKEFLLIVQYKASTLLQVELCCKKKKKAFLTLAISLMILIEKALWERGSGSEKIMIQLSFTCTGTHQHINNHVKILHTVL